VVSGVTITTSIHHCTTTSAANLRLTIDGSRPNRDLGLPSTSINPTTGQNIISCSFRASKLWQPLGPFEVDFIMIGRGGSLSGNAIPNQSQLLLRILRICIILRQHTSPRVRPQAPGLLQSCWMMLCRPCTLIPACRDWSC
jgi:hypothetical protein